MPDQLLGDSYDPPACALRLAHKDVSLAVQLGHDVGVPMRMIYLAPQGLTEARDSGEARGGAGRARREQG